MYIIGYGSTFHEKKSIMLNFHCLYYPLATYYIVSNAIDNSTSTSTGNNDIPTVIIV